MPKEIIKKQNQESNEYYVIKKRPLEKNEKGYVAGGWTGYMDGYLKKNLDAAKDMVAKDWDMVICIDGYEGSGKSVLAQQCAYYCDPTLTMDRICFNPNEFKKAITNAKKYEAVIFDEAYGGMSSRASISDVNRSLMMMLAEIRQKNLFVFIVLPCFFELDKYAAVWRSRALLHVYTGNKHERGFFSFYSQEKKKMLYVSGKKFFSYKMPKPDFFGRFIKGYPLDENEYRKKKDLALRDYSKDDEHKPTANQIKHKEQRDLLMKALHDRGLKQKEIAKIIGFTESGVGSALTRQQQAEKASPQPLLLKKTCSEMDDDGGEKVKVNNI